MSTFDFSMAFRSFLHCWSLINISKLRLLLMNYFNKYLHNLMYIANLVLINE